MTCWLLSAVQFSMRIFQLDTTNRVRSFINRFVIASWYQQFKIRAIDPVYPHPSRKGFQAEASDIKRFPFVRSTNSLLRWPVSFRAALLIVSPHTFCSCTTLCNGPCLADATASIWPPVIPRRRLQKNCDSQIGNF